jgi:hypothetical protein
VTLPGMLSNNGRSWLQLALQQERPPAFSSGIYQKQNTCQFQNSYMGKGFIDSGMKKSGEGDKYLTLRNGVKSPFDCLKPVMIHSMS